MSSYTLIGVKKENFKLRMNSKPPDPKRHDDFWLLNLEWHLILSLAEDFGWEPVGTEAPSFAGTEYFVPESEWDGSYGERMGQVVTGNDTENIAAALEKALPEININDAPDNFTQRLCRICGQICGDAVSDIMEKNIKNRTKKQEALIDPYDVDPTKFFEDKKSLLEAFIRFCEISGGFIIF